MSAATHEIQQVIAQYGSALDTHDLDALAAVHRDDAEWSFAVRDQVVMGPIRGRDAIIGFASAPPDGPPVQQRHLLTNTVITGAADGTSRATALLTLIAVDGTTPVIVATGTATFTLSVADEVWRIATLRIAFDNPPLPH
ncbi:MULTISPECIES: nuclear transport factor 2 family protein [unclassified Curtobacterium]|uniref:nuclear transport factor 2 family protein n=1 Tax=unclassified Curtobacterium TaxID=257496 RepID=UPI000D9687B6|nr:MULTISPECIES: nuclear transport factor 2 family protein [unclassified Curtobacterium]PYY36367.1 hypothetical protein DEI89_04135 [Curtobacterium sp. MCBD17_030]PZE37199.1 hypothetical protein DEJ31_08795 [Curtobacterium sp. MCPF17_031]PZF15465.1 hypothetical protein DEJ25_01685 [Curtobacterium sp. MCPF17_011]